MNKVFLCTRVKYDTKTKKGGVCTIVYSFQGEKIIHLSEINVSKRRLILMGILKGLESIQGMIPAEIQIDGGVGAEIREVIKTRFPSQDTEDYDLLLKIIENLSSLSYVWRKAKDYSGKSMVEKAAFYAVANVGVGYIPGFDKPVVYAGPTE